MNGPRKTAPACALSALNRLERILDDQDARSRPPVHLWNPALQPDIGLAIQRDGTWTYEGSAIKRPELVKLFASVMRRETDGRHYIVTPVEKVPVRVADAPFLAVEMETRGSGIGQELVLRTNVDDVVVAGPAHPIRFQEETVGGGLKPYVTVRDGLEALVTRALYYELVALGDVAPVEGTDHFGVWSGQRFFAMMEAAALNDLDDGDAAAQ